MRQQFGTIRERPAAAGFTLIELLVVSSIIAILIAILVPILSRARAAANRTVCLSKIRQLGAGILMYCQENKGWFPTCAYWDNGVSYVSYPEDWIHWQANRNLNDSAIAKYVGRGDQLKSLLRCPADSLDGRKAGLSIKPGQGPYLYSYGMNESLAENDRIAPLRTKITQWRAPSRKIMLTEGAEKYCTAPVWGYSGLLTLRHGTTRFHGNVPGNPDYVPGAKVGANVNAVFLDGHAEGIDQNVAFNVIQQQPEAQ
jgi:prepilin-type N-terminal cleavage/methylation domain-containing protein/prepilin-type processing-associated H-X9-DG protein